MTKYLRPEFITRTFLLWIIERHEGLKIDLKGGRVSKRRLLKRKFKLTMKHRLESKILENGTNVL